MTRYLLFSLFFFFTFILCGAAVATTTEFQFKQLDEILQKNPTLFGTGNLTTGDRELLGQITQSCDVLLQQNITLEQKKWTVAVKLRALLTLYMQNLTLQPAQVTELQQLNAELAEDEVYRGLVAKCEQLIFQQQLYSILRAQPGDKTDRYAVEKAIKEYAEKNFSKEAEQTVKSLLQVAKNLAGKDPDFAVTTYNDMAEVYAKSKFEDDVTYSKKLQGAARRFALPGNPMPFVGMNANGDKISNEDFKDKVILVDFWASWCNPCLASIPTLKELYRKYRSRGFEIVGINIDVPYQDFQKYIDKEGILWPQICDSALINKGGKRIADYYGVTEVPTLILIGKNGKVIATDFDILELPKKLQQLLVVSNVEERSGDVFGTTPVGSGTFGLSSSLNEPKDELQTPGLLTPNPPHLQ